MKEKKKSRVQPLTGPHFKNNNPKFGVAFITFTSPSTVTKILSDYSRNPSKFSLTGAQFHLRSSRNQMTSNVDISITNNPSMTDPSVSTFKLNSAMYGTLMGMNAMRNLMEENSEDDGTSASQYGFIIHQHFDTILNSSWLSIDTKQRTFRIDMVLTINGNMASGSKGHFRFKWNFRDLKGNKFLPVITYELLSTKRIPSLYILCEIHQPPCISYIRTRKLTSGYVEDEIRLPGSSLIGRANAWLLSFDSNSKTYADFASLLVQYNLCTNGGQMNSMIPLLTSTQQHPQQFIHIELLFMKQWCEKNRIAIERFISQRWPIFPFETKFEIMKLISKHIITFNDLILDERLEFILGKISFNTLTSCVDKITEFAHHWQPTSEKANGEDWNDDEDDDDDYPEKKEVDASRSLYSAIGKPLNTGSSVSTSIKLKDLNDPKNGRIGSLSRLLCLGLLELRRKHQLNQTVEGQYLTKHEIRPLKSNAMSSIRKVIVTPSIKHYAGPHVEEACAVTRYFSNLHDCFLRLSFRDEDYSKLKDINNSMDILHKRIKSLMTDGVIICGQKYRFLAFSSSQLREHSCWMFHRPVNSEISCEKIREWMGDFQNIHPVAKMAARLGQSFSTTVKGKELLKESFNEILDVTSPDDSKVLYTDGIGIIASWFADELAQQMGLQSTPSAFQIRFAGYKGMVCVSLENTINNDPTIRVAFRPSMKKFDSDNYSIDIVRSADYSSCYLNRQIILLLSSRQIPNDVFHQCLDEMLKTVKSMNSNSRCAIDTLYKFNGRSGGNETHRMMIEYFSHFHLNTEPFVQQLLFSFQAYHLKELRTKTRIWIEKGCFLFGVADESRTLQHGEVFIQISRDESSEPQKVIGPVIVTRNPCLHPGDIRRYEAVDKPELRKLKNVIVFPMDGPRSMTSELAGGDLDGDTFWICWDPRLIFIGNYEAFCYNEQASQATVATANTTLKTSYTIDDICRFFVDYMKADNLGIIATWHMALADRYGAEDKKCLSLASMHSIAVDFVKTGHRPPPLTKDLQPDAYPQFMERRDKKLQPSRSILSQLYDVVKRTRLNVDHPNNPDKKPFPYASLIVKGYLSYTEKARILKDEYDRELKRIMRHYGSFREGELISGYITKFKSQQYAKQEKLFELRNEIASAVQTLRNKYIQIFWQEFYQIPKEDEELDPLVWQEATVKLTWHNQLMLADYHDKHFDTVEHKASAWFYVTYEEELNNNKDEINQNDRLYSFPWLVYPVLLHIYSRCLEDDETSFEIYRTTKRKNNNQRRRGRERRKRQKT